MGDNIIIASTSVDHLFLFLPGISSILSTISSPIAANGTATKVMMTSVFKVMSAPVDSLTTIKSSTIPIITPKIRNSRNTSNRCQFIQ